MICENCKKEYNSTNRKHCTLPCSHNICLKCNYNLKKQDFYTCPFCDQKFDKTIKCQIDSQKIQPIQKNLTNQLIEDSKSQVLINNQKETNLEFKYRFNFATLGNLSTGKTCILHKYFNQKFSFTKPTISVEFFTKVHKFKNTNILLKVADTNGSEQYKSLTSKYIYNQHILLFVFDLTDKKSFQDIKNWIKWSDDYSKKNVIKILVGNKKDLQEKIEIDNDKIIQFATNQQMNYFEVSAKTGENIERLFDFCWRKCYFKFKGEQQQEKQHDDFQFKLKHKPQKKKNSQTKKHKKHKSRKAMLVEPLKAHNYVGTMSANNSPQINAPRMLVKNVPEPRDSTTSYPEEIKNTQPNLPPLTVLPPSFVNAELDGPQKLNALTNSSSPTSQSGSSMTSMPKSPTSMTRFLRGHKKRGRKLNVLPYMNMGPGYMDFGSNGFSPMSFAMSHPQMSSMSPFIPRSTPPAPVRIQLRDSVAERFKSNFLTTSERAVKDKDVDSLKSQVEHEMVKFTEELGAAQEDLGIYLERIQNKLEDYETHRRTVKNEIAVMQQEIDKKKEQMNKEETENNVQIENLDKKRI